MDLQELKKTIKTAAKYGFNGFFTDRRNVEVIALKEIFKRSSDIFIFGDLQEDFDEQLKNPDLNLTKNIHEFMNDKGRKLTIAFSDPEKFKLSSFYNFLQPYHDAPSYKLDFRSVDEKFLKFVQDNQYKEIVLSTSLKNRFMFSRTKTGYLTDPQKTFQTYVDFNTSYKNYCLLKKLFNQSSQSIKTVEFWELLEAVPEFSIPFSKNIS